MNCPLGQNLPIAALVFNPAGACAVCNTNCDRCDPTGGAIKCHKCSEGQTCTLDCSTHPWANVEDTENGECVSECPSYTFVNLLGECEVTNKCDEDCLVCVKGSDNKGKCLKCSDDRKGNPQVGYLGMCMNRQSCPNGAFLVETETHHYCEKCEANCDKCIDETECTHCSVAPDRYHLEDGDCIKYDSPLVVNHYAEVYDEFYS